MRSLVSKEKSCQLLRSEGMIMGEAEAQSSLSYIVKLFQRGGGRGGTQGQEGFMRWVEDALSYGIMANCSIGTSQ